VQILTGVYLAGVLFPCLVTALTFPRTVVQVGSGVDGEADDRGDRVRLTSGLGRIDTEPLSSVGVHGRC
jgi:hypothetical protein